MKHTSTIFFTFLLQIFAVLPCFAQKETNIWYFGRNAGLDFNSVKPRALTDGMLNTWEGCATISDTSGKLLFYTDGDSVWNKNHTLMTNGTGLLGHASSTQTAIIIPKPSTDKIYYIFTVSSWEKIRGLNYSEVDMSLSRGNGNITAMKNIELFEPATEGLTAVRHANDTDIWVIAHKIQSDSFYAYLVTSSGINPAPVISKIGIWVGNFSVHGIGYMKVSPIGNKIAVAHWNSVWPQIQLFDFNAITGVLSNLYIIKHKYNGGGPYGIEFSPSGNMLYASETNETSKLKMIYQYDLTATDIVSSKYVIDSMSTINSAYGCLQLGSDAKIYVCNEWNYYLGVINEPELLGSDCNYIRNGISLANKTSSLGLPSFISSLFKPKFIYKHTCKSDNTEFQVVMFRYDSLFWDFGDPVSGSLNYSVAPNPTHVFSDTGNYQVNLTIYNKGKTLYSEQKLRIYGVFVEFGNDTTLCIGKTLQLNATTPNAKYLWNDSSTKPVLTISDPGFYKVKVSSKRCFASDSINVKYDSLPQINLGSDTTFCQSQKLMLNATHPNSSYLWQDGSKASSFEVTKSGIYWVKLSNICGSVADSISVNYFTTSSVNLGNDTTLCKGQTIILDASNPGSSYLWQDGATTPLFSVSQAGNYWVKVSNICGTATDDIKVSYITVPPDNLGRDTAICLDSTLTIDVNIPNSTYLWQDGSTEPFLKVDSGGIYFVDITNECGTSADTFHVRFDDCNCKIFIPNSFTPNNDGINDIFKPVAGCYLIDYKLCVFNRWGEKVFENNNIDKGWDGTYLTQKAPDGQYFYVLQYRIDINGKKGFRYGSLLLMR